MRTIFFPLLLTISGVAVLMALGVWQLQRLEWKEDVLAGIETRMSAEPMVLPVTLSEAEDEYRAAQVSGRLGDRELHVLTSGTAAGTGYRVITALDTGERQVLVDLGLLPLDQKGTAPSSAAVSVLGHLVWPDDVNSSTPEPDRGANIWFGRDVEAMAAELQTEPVMIVASRVTPASDRTTLLPVDTGTIKNDHLEYAITWFSLAIVWGIMGLYLIRRTVQRT